MEEIMAGKKILDVTCGSRTIWFNKNHPAAIYCDIRDEECTGTWKSTNRDSTRTCVIHPDVRCDFTELPFADNSFALVVFDPPHLLRVGENAWMRKKYGALGEGWEQMLHDGFCECMRVLRQDGVLIFKWAETQIPAAKVWQALGQKPLFGHHSGKKSKTFWGCFMKLVVQEQPTIDAVPVVRCKYCRYAAKAQWNKKGYRICPASHMEITDDDFCSYGERRDT